GYRKMPVRITRGKSDEVLKQIMVCLEAYERDHPQVRIDFYRYSPVSIRIRIIDPRFSGMGRADRSDLVWKYFDRLTDEVQSDISMLVLLTPSEVGRSLADREFEDPVSPGVNVI